MTGVGAVVLGALAGRDGYIFYSSRGEHPFPPVMFSGPLLPSFTMLGLLLPQVTTPGLLLQEGTMLDSPPPASRDAGASLRRS